MIFDTMLQALPGKTHVQSDGSNIGGVDPAKYGFQTIPGKKQALLLTTEGTTKAGEYPAFMWYPASPRPILGDVSKLELRMTYVLGGNLRGCNVIETDTILVMNGLKFNGSAQYNQSLGEFQVTDAKGDWVNAGLRYGELETNTRYELRIAYDFDLANKLRSIPAIGLLGGLHLAPADLQKIPATPCDWKPGIYLQIQLGSTPSAEPWSLLVKKAEYVWS